MSITQAPQNALKPLERSSSDKRGWLDAWHVNPSSNTDYSLVDGLRGIAILLVAACHLIYTNPKSGALTHFIGGFFAGGGFGVPIFFCLSGFLITLPFWNRKVRNENNATPPGYGWRRFWKIYPPLAASLLVFTPIYISRTHDWSYLAPAVQWLLGLSFLVPVDGRLNPVMWSLAVEIQFYIVIPIVFASLKRVSARQSLWILLAGFLLVPNAFRWLVYGGHGPTFYPQINSHFPAALDSFAFGIALAGMESLRWTQKRWAKIGNIGFLLLFTALLSTGWVALHHVAPVWLETAQQWTVTFAAGLMLCFIADPQYAVSKWLCATPLRWLGIISYELYLVHQPIIVWARASFGPCDGSVLKYVALVGGSFVASVAIAALFYKLFSLPILQAGRKRHVSPANSKAA